MTELTFFILGSIVAIVCATISFFEKKKENRDNSKSNTFNTVTYLFIFIGILIALISGYYSLIEKQKSDAIAASKSDTIIRIQQNNMNETRRLNSSLSEAKDKIISLQSEINRNIVGGIGPCYIAFQTANDKKGATVFVNEGKLSILDLDIYITDYNKMMQCKQSFRDSILLIDEPC